MYREEMYSSKKVQAQLSSDNFWQGSIKLKFNGEEIQTNSQISQVCQIFPNNGFL